MKRITDSMEMEIIASAGIAGQRAVELSLSGRAAVLDIDSGELYPTEPGDIFDGDSDAEQLVVARSGQWVQRRIIETTLGVVRLFPGWHDGLEVGNEESVTVRLDGSAFLDSGAELVSPEDGEARKWQLWLTEVDKIPEPPDVDDRPQGHEMVCSFDDDSDLPNPRMADNT